MEAVIIYARTNTHSLSLCLPPHAHKNECSAPVKEPRLEIEGAVKGRRLGSWKKNQREKQIFFPPTFWLIEPLCFHRGKKKKDPAWRIFIRDSRWLSRGCQREFAVRLSWCRVKTLFNSEIPRSRVEDTEIKKNKINKVGKRHFISSRLVRRGCTSACLTSFEMVMRRLKCSAKQSGKQPMQNVWCRFDLAKPPYIHSPNSGSSFH